MSAKMITTGVPELDAALATFERKTVRKWVVKALNDALMMVEKAYKANCPVDSGAMRDATVRRRPRGLKRGEVGRALIIVREKLFKLIAKRTGRSLFYLRKGKKKIEQFFYPAVVELGDKDTPAQRPLRGALYGNENHVRDLFVKNVRAAVDEAGRGKNAVSLEASSEMAWALDLNN